MEKKEIKKAQSEIWAEEYEARMAESQSYHADAILETLIGIILDDGVEDLHGTELTLSLKVGDKEFSKTVSL